MYFLEDLPQRLDTGASPTFASITNTAVGTGAFITLGAATGTNRVYGWQYTNTTGSFFGGIESSAGGAMFTGGLAYASGIGSGSATAFHLITNNTVRLTVSSGGNVLVNGLTTDGTGAMQFATGTTSAGGIAFSTDTFLFRSGASTTVLKSSSGAQFLVVDTGSAASSGTIFYSNGTEVARVIQASGSLTLGTGSSGTTALAIDSSQNATLGLGTAGNNVTLTLNGGSNSVKGAYIGFQQASTFFAYIGREAPLASNSANNLCCFAVAAFTIYTNNATLALTVDTSQNASWKGSELILNATAIPAGGTAGAGYKFSSTSNFGTFFGSGAPTLAAAKGSLYLRSDGTTTNNRAYINTDGSTTWTALTTAA